MDPYDAIIGTLPPVTEKDKIAALTKSLRKQQELGQLASMIAMDPAQKIGASFQDDSRHSLDLLARQRNLKSNDEAALHRLRLTLAAKEEAAGPKLKPLPESSAKNLRRMATTAGTIEAAAQWVEKNPGRLGSKFPKGANFTEYMAREYPAMAKPEWIEESQVRGQIERGYEMLQRNAMFGATLSNNEQTAWRRAYGGESLNPEQTKSLVNGLRKLARFELDREKASLLAAGGGVYDPDQIEALSRMPIQSAQTGEFLEGGEDDIDAQMAEIQAEMEALKGGGE